MTRKLLKYTFGLPLLVMPHVLNFLLQDFADSLHYTTEDMTKYPVVFSTLGWLMAYLVLIFISPVLLLVQPLFLYGTLLTSMIVFGLLLWLVAIAYGFISLGWIVKKLTARLLSFKKVNISLRSQKLTTDEETVSSRTVHLYHTQRG